MGDEPTTQHDPAPPPIAAVEAGEVLDVVEAKDPSARAVAPRNTISLAGMSLERLGDVFAQSGMFKDAQDPAKAMVKIIAGAELGLSPFASMTGVYIVEGKPSVGGHLLAGILRNHQRYRYQIVQLTNEICELAFYEKDPGTGTWVEMTPHSVFTIDDARQADLAGKANYKRYPRNMLFWRALSNGVKFHAPDVFGGIPVYTPDELGVEIQPDGSVVGDDGPRPGAATARTALPPRAQPAAPVPTPTPHATGTVKTEATLNANERRRLWALAGDAGIKENEPLLRLLIEWTTGEVSTERVARSKKDELYAAITDHEGTLSTIVDLAAEGDERARGLLAKYMPAEVPAPREPAPEADPGAPQDLPPATDGENGDDLGDPSQLPL